MPACRQAGMTLYAATLVKDEQADFEVAGSSWTKVDYSTVSSNGLYLLKGGTPAGTMSAGPAVTVGVGRGAELGVLVKNGEALEKSEKLTTVVFDKTGTLTKGKPEVTDVVSIGVDENLLLMYAASVEKNSLHPLAEAIVKKAGDASIKESTDLGDVVD